MLSVVTHIAALVVGFVIGALVFRANKKQGERIVSQIQNVEDKAKNLIK